MDLLSTYSSDEHSEGDPDCDNAGESDTRCPTASDSHTSSLSRTTKSPKSTAPFPVAALITSQNRASESERCCVTGSYGMIMPCQALLDDEDPEQGKNGQIQNGGQNESAARLSVDEGSCCEPAPKRPRPDPQNSLGASSVESSDSATQTVDMMGILDRPPVQIASLADMPRSHRPQCKLPRAKIHSFHEHSAPVMNISWHDPHGQLLASCGMDGKLCIWEPWVRRKCVQQLRPHQSQAVRCGQWYASSSSSVQFLSGGYDKYLRLTDVETGQCVVGLRHDAYVTAVSRHPTQRDVVVTGTAQRSLAAWDLQSGKKLHDCVPAVGQVQDILFLPDDERFVVACDTHRRSDADRSLGVWDFKSGVRLVDQIYPEPFSCTSLLLDKGMKNLLAQSNSGHVAIFQAVAPYKLNKFKRFEGHQVSGFPLGCCLSPDGKFLYSPSTDGRLFCYAYQSSKVIKTWQADPCQQSQSAIVDVAHHPLLPSALASSSWHGEICLWM